MKEILSAQRGKFECKMDDTPYLSTAELEERLLNNDVEFEAIEYTTALDLAKAGDYGIEVSEAGVSTTEATYPFICTLKMKASGS